MMRWGRDGAHRLVGVDIARGFAILGMLWVHFAPDDTGATPADGRSAILFATLAGVSLGLMTGGPRPLTGRRRRASFGSIAIRGVVLIVIGRLLVLLMTPIAVILDYYGVLFLVMLVVLYAPRWVLAVVVVAAVSVGPVLIQAAGPDPGAAFLSDDVLAWPGQWFLTGLYPIVLFVGYVAAGLIAARSDLSRTRVQLVLLGGGSVLAVAGYAVGGALGVDAGAHSNTTWEAIGSGGVALAVIGLLQYVSRYRPVRAVLSPVADMGAMPLTIYTGQVVVAALFLATQPADAKFDILFWGLLAALASGSLIFAVLWRRLVGRGPLEQLLAVLSRPPTAEPVSDEPLARTSPRSFDAGRAPPPVRVVRAIGVAGLAGLTAVVLVVGASLVIGPGRADPARADVVAEFAAPSGDVAVTLDAELLEQAGVSVGAIGAARSVGAAVALPVVAGQAVATTATVTGGIALNGAGLSLTRGAETVDLTDLVVDFDAGTVAGAVSANGGAASQGELLFTFAAVEPPAEGASGQVILRPLTLDLFPPTAALLDERLGSASFAAAAEGAGVMAVVLSGG